MNHFDSPVAQDDLGITVWINSLDRCCKVTIAHSSSIQLKVTVYLFYLVLSFLRGPHSLHKLALRPNEHLLGLYQ